MSSAPLDRLQRAFRVGPTPGHLDHVAAEHYGTPGTPSHERLIAYVRHHFTNYERVCKYIPCSQVEHYAFRDWVNSQIEDALSRKMQHESERAR